MSGSVFYGVAPDELPFDDIDWEHRGGYIRTRSSRKPGDFDVEPEWATEAVFDENRMIAAPDPASKSGESVRLLGYSQSVNRVLVVILRPKNLPTIDGVWWGVNAWAANSMALRRYRG